MKDINLLVTIIGTAITTIATIYGFMRNIKTDTKNDFDRLEKRMAQLDNRMFQLAMGKSFKDILLEEKQEEEKK